MEAKVDHIAHGWALLSMRIPQLRRLAPHRQRIAEMCEAYSLAVLHLQTLRNLAPESHHICEYEEIIAGLEDEATYYLKMLARCSA